MSQSEPGWGVIDAEVNGSACHTQADPSFEVALGSRLRKNWGEVRARSFENKGTIRISDERLTIRTSVSRLLGANLDTSLELRCADIYNVRVKKKLVQFDLLNGPGELEPLILRARNKGEAAAIAAAMPRQMTPRYATENQARLRFLETIRTRTPHVWATWAIVAVTSLMFLAMAVRGAGFASVSSLNAIAYGSNFGPYTLTGQWWRLLTSVFVHFGLVHFACNMFALVQIGRIAERMFGTARFLALYLFAGLTGSMMSLLWHPGINSAGASGAIFGVLAGLLAYEIRYRDSIPRSIYLKHLQTAVIFISYTLVWGLTHRGIDNGAHIGGLIGGFMLGWLLAPPLDNAGSSRERAIMTLGASGALACVMLGGLAWMLSSLSTRPETREVMHFSEVLQQLGPTASKAAADLKTMAHMPATAEERAEYSHRIRTSVLPEWNQLYATINDVPVPARTPEAVTKGELLHYFADLTRAMEITAATIDNDRLGDPRPKAQIKALLGDAKLQLAALRKGAAPF